MNAVMQQKPAGLWSRLFARPFFAPPLATKASATGSLIALSSLGRPVWTPRDYDRLAREGLREQSQLLRGMGRQPVLR